MVLLRILSSICIFLFLIVMLMGLTLPIYTDEYLWKIFGSRLFIDDWKLVYGFPECIGGYLLPPPITWLPEKIIESWWYSDMTHPIKHRYIGLLGFVAIIAMTTWLIRRFTTYSYTVCLGIILGVFSIGSLPLMMLLNRPEQSILLYILIASLLPIWLLKNLPKKDLTKNIFWTGIYFLLSFSAFAAHPKAQFFILFFIICYLSVVHFKKHTFLSLVFILGLVFSMLETINLWKLRTNCPESPWLTNVLSSLTISPKLFWENPNLFFQSGWSNYKGFVDYISNVSFKKAYQNDWLPDVFVDPTLFENFLNKANYYPIIIMGILISFNLFYWAKKRTGDLRWGTLTIVLLISLGAIIFFQNNRNFYESSLIIPLIILIWLFTLGINPIKNENTKLNFVFAIIVTLACLQLGGLINRFYEVSQTTWPARYQGLKRMQEQSLKLAVEKCGFTKLGMSNLILDEATYTAFWSAPNPMFVHAIFGWWGTGVDYKTVIKKQRAQGILSICSGLPKEIQDISVSDGLFCCVKDPALKLGIN